MHRLATAIFLLCIMQGCTDQNGVRTSELLGSGRGANPVMRYNVIKLPPNVTVADVKGAVFFAVKGVGLIPVNTGSNVKDGTVLVIEGEAYVLLNCSHLKCAEFNPALETRWVIINTAE